MNQDKTEYGDGEPYDPFRDDFWAKYLQIPQGERHHDYVDNVVVPSQYKPTKGDATFGIGKPFEIYDRLYLDNFYQIDSKPDYDSYYGGYLPPAIKEEKQGKKR